MISHYPSITMTNGTVQGIDFVNSTAGIPTFTAHVVLPSGETVEVKARSIVLAIGLKDDIPNTPGLEENWGKGIYWVSSKALFLVQLLVTGGTTR